MTVEAIKAPTLSGALQSGIAAGLFAYFEREAQRNALECGDGVSALTYAKQSRAPTTCGSVHQIKRVSRMAFKPCEKTTEGAYRLRSVKSTGQVSGTAFLKFYNIPFGQKSTAYPAAWEADSGMLVVSL